MRNTAQIWWAQTSSRGNNGAIQLPFRHKLPKMEAFCFVQKEGDDNVACKSKPIVTSPKNHCNGTKAPRKGYLPPWASYSPASLRYSCRKWATHKSLATPRRPLDTSSDLRYLQLLRSIVFPTARRCVFRALRPPVALFKVGCAGPATTPPGRRS